jgi:hypothetical protein
LVVLRIFSQQGKYDQVASPYIFDVDTDTEEIVIDLDAPPPPSPESLYGTRAASRG